MGSRSSASTLEPRRGFGAEIRASENWLAIISGSGQPASGEGVGCEFGITLGGVCHEEAAAVETARCWMGLWLTCGSVGEDAVCGPCTGVYGVRFTRRFGVAGTRLVALVDGGGGKTGGMKAGIGVRGTMSDVDEVSAS